MKTDPTFWLLARASGITAYLLLTTSMLAGLVLKARPFRSLKPAQVTDIHRFLALLGLGTLALHGATLLLDRAVTIPWIALLVPGLSPYRPLAVGIGVLAAELMLVVYVSFGQRKRIGAKTWRKLHFASFVVFAGAAAHGLLAGSDTQQPWARALYLLTIGAVVGATAFRALAPKPAPPARATREERTGRSRTARAA